MLSGLYERICRRSLRDSEAKDDPIFLQINFSIQKPKNHFSVMKTEKVVFFKKITHFNVEKE